jgi:aryl-alcohol dehydrogenase (NADP+)
MQNHYNLIYREEEREMNPLCRDEGIGLLPWSPLARGFLTGNRKRGEFGDTSRAKTDDYAQKLYYTEADYVVADRLTEVSAKLGTAPARVALAWVLHQPGVTAPIVGASKPHHIPDAVAALDVKLDAEVLKALAEPYQPHPILGHA